MLSRSAKRFLCNLCGEGFSRKTAFDSHYRTHTKEKPYECDICQKSFSDKSNLNRHHRSHTNTKPYSCNICGKTFSDKSHHNAHYRIHANEKNFICDQCGKAFLHNFSLVLHYRMHTNEKPFVCKVCGKAFSDRSSSVRHHRVHTKEKPFKCALCEKPFSDKATLNRHLRIHTNEKPFSCDLCSKSFTQKSSLNCHLYTHQDEKPFKCTPCRKSFIKQKDLDRHSRTHACQKSSDSESYYDDVIFGKQHLPKAKEEPFGSEVYGGLKSLDGEEFQYLLPAKEETFASRLFEEDSFKCLVSGKSFIKRKDLDRHSRTHADEKSLEGEEFHGEATFAKHLLQAKEEPPVKEFYSGTFTENPCKLNTHSNKSDNMLVEKSDLSSIHRVFSEENHFGCDICGKLFACKSDFITHECYTHVVQKSVLGTTYDDKCLDLQYDTQDNRVSFTPETCFSTLIETNEHCNIQTDCKPCDI